MNGPLEHARGWIAKGDNDLCAARLVFENKGPLDIACFHSQQAAEKYLKAILAYDGRPIARTHDLEEILEECLALHPQLGLTATQVSFLTPYAVELRYDLTFLPDRRGVDEALQVVALVRAKMLTVLPSGVEPQQT